MRPRRRHLQLIQRVDQLLVSNPTSSNTTSLNSRLEDGQRFSRQAHRRVRRCPCSHPTPSRGCGDLSKKVAPHARTTSRISMQHYAEICNITALSHSLLCGRHNKKHAGRCRQQTKVTTIERCDGCVRGLGGLPQRACLLRITCSAASYRGVQTTACTLTTLRARACAPLHASRCLLVSDALPLAQLRHSEINAGPAALRRYHMPACSIPEQLLEFSLLYRRLCACEFRSLTSFHLEGSL